MTPEKRRPAAGSSRGGPSDSVSGQGRADLNPQNRARQFRLTFRILPDGPRVTVTGRVAQTLALLIKTGPKGFTSGEASPLGWARRTSHYILELRRRGLLILTVWESAGDCRIGRYILQSPVSVVPEEGAQ